MKLARTMIEEGYGVHWSVVRATLRGETQPRDFNDTAFDAFIHAHASEIEAAIK